ncbi:elongation factor G [Chitinimonas lacunae]|uniref:Elongation factor G n=1 Tax=Chitinimonas lacunae TaxID=1963018 RepID=A0ABV8MQV2_9NEIS
METRKLRNIGIIAHVDAGKTTTSERILYYCGASHRMGEVHEGSAAMDFDPQEQARGITINSAATQVNWRDHAINLIDTPGHIDFNIEVNRSLRVLDGAVVVFDAVAGVEPQTETNWRLADHYRVPRIGFINKLDRVGADVTAVLSGMRERLGTTPLLLQWPLGEEDQLRGVIDLLTMQALVWPEQGAGHYSVAAIPVQLQAIAQARRAELIEAAAEFDDVALADYLEGRQPDIDRLRAAIRRATLAGLAVPVLLGSAYRNKGIEPLLDAVLDYLPAPAELAERQPVEADSAGPLAALLFKVSADDHGNLAYLRLYRGKLRPGDSVIDGASGRRERVGRLYQMHADRKVEQTLAVAGDIVAVSGLKSCRTGDTLCHPQHPLLLESIVAPEPVIEIALEARQQTEQTRLALGLQTLVREDPSLRLRQDEQSGQTLLAGMGELQLEVTLEKLRSRFGMTVATGQPRVAYRETIATASTSRYLHKKQSGGPGQYAEVVLRLEPLAAGSGVLFDNQVVGGAVPRELVPAVETGIRAACEAGVLAACPLTDLRVSLIDGSYHERDSSALAFQLAAAEALRQGARAAGLKLLEPVMTVEVITPAEALGDCIGDLQRRRGQVQHQQIRGHAFVLEAEVPLAEMFGYIGRLRTLSAGRASFSMHLAGYREVPAALTKVVVVATTR